MFGVVVRVTGVKEIKATQTCSSNLFKNTSEFRLEHYDKSKEAPLEADLQQKSDSLQIKEYCKQVATYKYKDTFCELLRPCFANKLYAVEYQKGEDSNIDNVIKTY